MKTLVHSPFPRFKTFLEDIFWDLFKLRRRSHFDGIDVRKMSSLQNRFDLREEKKVTRSQIGGVWRVFRSCNVSFCEKLTNTQGCVSRNVIVTERPCVSFSKAPPLVRLTCPVYLHIPWIGNVSMRFEKQITSAVKRCFFSVEPRVIFNTRRLLPAIKKDVLPSHHHSNVIYQFLCHCDSRYVGRTSQRLEERIKQHVPKSITNPRTSANRQSLSRSCKNNIRPQQFHESAIDQHLLDNAQCALHYSNEKFSILARGRSSFHLSALEATFIKSLNPILCKQKEFVYSLKIS